MSFDGSTFEMTIEANVTTLYHLIVSHNAREVHEDHLAALHYSLEGFHRKRA